jgi:hypothetical protein
MKRASYALGIPSTISLEFSKMANNPSQCTDPYSSATKMNEK